MATILIIEDDLPIQRMFKQFLESFGYTIVCADDGREGLRLLNEQRPDLVITDIMMPEMDGLEVIQQIHKHQAGLPVIAISGGMRDMPINFLPHARAFGAAKVFEKPVPLAALMAAVQELLHKPGATADQS